MASPDPSIVYVGGTLPQLEKPVLELPPCTDGVAGLLTGWGGWNAFRFGSAPWIFHGHGAVALLGYSIS